MDELRQLADTGDYLFHGSATNSIATLEPRQAISHGKPDGEPCIAASEQIEPAIFMAVLGSRHTGGWGKDNPPRGQYGFYVRRKDYEQAKAEKWNGYVYVLPRAPFEHFAAWEWRAFMPIKPVKVIKVGFSELPAQIELTE
ncbi:MAG TPA: hypothetical protein VLH84_03630 [Patescibacteria group bacterium]|nr:hypothetical protein [Patescibacteria group bacterium]